MKKLMNAPETMLAESLDGFAIAHADVVTLGPDRRFVRRRSLTPSKTALVSGGGSGHEPLHVGFVGRGMLDAACPGRCSRRQRQTRSSPPPPKPSTSDLAACSSSRIMKAT